MLVVLALLLGCFQKRYGGAKRDRTADLYNAIVALSQLSYSPNVRFNHSYGISRRQAIADQKVLTPKAAHISYPCVVGCLTQASLPMQVNFPMTAALLLFSDQMPKNRLHPIA